MLYIAIIDLAVALTATVIQLSTLRQPQESMVAAVSTRPDGEPTRPPAGPTATVSASSVGLAVEPETDPAQRWPGFRVLYKDVKRPLDMGEECRPVANGANLDSGEIDNDDDLIYCQQGGYPVLTTAENQPLALAVDTFAPDPQRCWDLVHSGRAQQTITFSESLPGSVLCVLTARGTLTHLQVDAQDANGGITITITAWSRNK